MISQFLTPSKSVPKTPYKLWSQKKPNLRHFHVLGCKVEVRSYNPQSKKLDPKTKFYCPSHTTRVIKSNQAIYFEDDIDTSQGIREIVFKEHPIFILVLVASLRPPALLLTSI